MISAVLKLIFGSGCCSKVVETQTLNWIHFRSCCRWLPRARMNFVFLSIVCFGLGAEPMPTPMICRKMDQVRRPVCFRRTDADADVNADNGADGAETNLKQVFNTSLMRRYRRRCRCRQPMTSRDRSPTMNIQIGLLVVPETKNRNANRWEWGAIIR